MVTVNWFDNGKFNDRFYNVKSSVYNLCPVTKGKINTIFKASEPLNDLKVMYIRLQSYTIFVIFRTFLTEIWPEPGSFMLTSQG